MRRASTILTRGALLAAASLLCLASSSQDPPPRYGPGQGPYGQPYGQPAPNPYGQPYGQPGAGQPGGVIGGGAPAGGSPGQMYCFSLKTAQTTTSWCSPGFGSCERAKQDAIADGLTTSDCVPWAPVACFQLAGDPAADAQFCAANLEDCDLWRRADLEKNGKTDQACAWKQ